MKGKLIASLAILALCLMSVGPAVAKGPAPSPGSGSGTGHGHRITNAERKAAAVRVAKARKAKGGAVAAAMPGTNAVMLGSTTATSVPTGTMTALAGPDYFGSVPNYANSPLPTSVSIQGDGIGAFATAVVNPDGTIGGFTLLNGGGGYTFADVVVIGGGGSGATGTTTIDPTTGAITAIALAAPGSGYGSTPGIRKFVDALPLLGPAGANDLGQYLPVAVADTASFPGSGNVPAADYYEIAVIQYTQQLHKDLPATTLRGYVQIETPANAGVSNHIALTYPDGTPILDGSGLQVYAVDNPQYLGPLIVAQKDRPVRVKFDNYLPAGTGGNLFLPVDGTIMGAGMGPTGGTYSQNRATLHLHGGVTPWISDGTQHQWTTPAGATEAYPRGVSVGFVPDQWYDASGNPIPSCSEQTTCAVAGATNDPGPGHLTFYYTNQQSARLMFYHDHAYGITRLNVYAGEAAGYLLRDQAEAALEAAGTLPGLADNIPLVIQDRTFVPSATQLAAEDPTWDSTAYGGYGNLWLPHVYMPNQNPGDMSGANPMGRWDYGAWFWPPNTQQVFGPVQNPLCDWTNPASPVCPPGENAYNPGTPNPTIVPEAFMDTILVNGTAYPYVTLQPKAYRLRILNASNDRGINLSLFYAASNAPMWNADGTLNDANAGEVPMVAAVRGGLGTAGYTYPDQLDGRMGGVPDSSKAGPSFIQIGTEGGFLSKPAAIKNGPVGFNYNRRDIVVLNVSNKSLFLGPAERADVIVDLSQVPAGSNLILYNDAPAPTPAFDTRYDYYTGDPDQVMNGGAPTTIPGYGPNTRTVMQIRIAGAQGAGANVAALNSAVPAYYGQMQPAPVVPEQGYDAAFGTTSPADPYARIQDFQKTFSNGSVSGLTITNAGSGYTSPPTVTISGGGGAGATAYATLSGSGISSLTLTVPGSGYTSPPAVTISPPELLGGVQATAAATLSTTIASVTVGNGGSGYTSAPSVSFSGGGGANAAGTAVLAPSGVASVSVSSGGSYTVAPSVSFSGGGSPPAAGGAQATAVLGPAPVANVNVTNGGSYTAAPTVTFSSGAAAGTASLTPTSVGSLQLLTGGVYITAPTVSFTGGGGSNASAIANLAATGSVGAVNVTNGGTGYTTPPNVVLGAPQTPGIQATAQVTALSPTGVGAVQLTNRGSCTSTASVPVTFQSVNGAGSGATGTATVGGRPRRVTSVTITNPGSGYTLPPTPVFGGTNCTGVQGTSSLQPTSVLTIAVTNPGSGYTSAPRVQFNGGGGTGATANSVLGRAVASLTLTSGGSGYTSPPAVNFTGSQFIGGPSATATATLTPTSVAAVTVTAGGSYTVAPTVGFTGGGAPPAAGGAQATAVLGAAPVASVNVTAPGSYTSAPTVAFSSGTAAATAALVPTSVASVTLDNPGSGYNTAPAVAFAGGGGSNAAATATLTPAPIFALTVTFAGSGYVNPTVTIDPPQTAGTTAEATASVTPSVLAGFVITNPGAGFVSAPSVTISGGGGSGAQASASITTAPATLAFMPKGIQELFEPFYGRMNATMSVEIPNTNGTNQTTIPYGNIDPPTELIDTNASDALAGASPLAMLPDGTQIWKFTHNGVDTHSVHFHMFNIELINRVGWDGAIRPPDPNEMGWKDTVRMNPLEDAIIAIKPIVPALPWALPNSIRPLAPADALGTSGIQYTNVRPDGNPVTEVNHLVNLGWEYVFHCHLLGHEENDMMRAVAVGVAPLSPSIGTPTAAGGSVTVSFTDNSINETGFTVQRSTDGVTWTNVGTVNRADPVWNALTQTVTDAGRTTGDVLTFIDGTVVGGTTYFYRVVANDVIGDTATAGFPSLSVDSVPSGASAGVTP